MKILGHFNFRTKSLPGIFVFNVCVNLEKNIPEENQNWISWV